MELLKIHDADQWNTAIEHLPGVHALQTWEWGQVKARFGWEPFPLAWRDASGQFSAAALLLLRKIAVGGLNLPLSVCYIPRGPLLRWDQENLSRQVLDDLEEFARKRGAIFLKLDPDLPLGYGIPGEETAEAYPSGLSIRKTLTDRGWVFSDEQIQFRNTILIDLTATEDELLMRMKPKTRYNIRLAARRGVSVRAGGSEDIDLLYQMYAHTAIRDEFTIRTRTYYQTVWETFFKAGLAEPLIAEVDGQPIGGVVIFRFGGRAWYKHGMSLDVHREKMFNYRLQWEAMLRAKAAGCHTYDLWGAPDTFTEADPLWGVYRFKDGFGGQVVRTLGAWDYPVQGLVYTGYCHILPRILQIMRSRGKKATQRSLST
ncbi:MAG: peptidoglycan bridge formation glycyltransferase FemA/FemB family protein [Chloroflexi bacterium]|nr:peptidoglycan bridge formation glycyltransferase FemA/FemB family protein [Chloroflexota bacterium]